MSLRRRRQSAMQWAVIASLIAMTGSAGRSQMPSQSTGQLNGTGQRQSTSGIPGSVDPTLDQPSPFRDSARQRMNAERQRKLVNDTQRLLALANQLKLEAAAAGTESLTLEMQHQMEEIEKLARSVKDKMRS